MTFNPDKFLAETNSTKRVPAQGASSGFNPDKFLEETSQVKQQQTSATESALQHFGNAATFGYLPQIQAAVEPAIQAIADKLLPEDPKGFNVQQAPDQSYVQRRDQYIQDQNQMASEHPTASMLGTIGGAISGGVGTGGAIAKGLGAGIGVVAPEMGAQISNGVRAGSALQRIRNASAVGGAIGAIRNPGDTQGEISPLQLGDRVKNIATDAALGGAIQGGGEAIGKIGSAIKSAPDSIKSFSQLKALKASGAMLKDFRKAFGNSKANELGQAAIDEGLIGIGDDIHAIAQKATAAKEEVGGKLSEIYDKADAVLGQSGGNGSAMIPGGSTPAGYNGFDLKGMADEMKKNIVEKYKGKAGGNAIVEKVSGILDEISSNDNVNFSKLKEIRQSVDELINYSKSNNEMSQIQSELRNVRNELQNQAKKGLSVIDEMHGTDLLTEFNKQNKRYSNIAELSKIASDKSARASSNAAFGLREQIGSGAGGAIGAVIGGPVGAAVGSFSGAAIAKVSKNYATPFVALTANKVARALESNPTALGVFSTPLLKAANNSSKDFVTSVGILMKQPEFKQAIESLHLKEIASQRPPIKREPGNKFTRSNQ